MSELNIKTYVLGIVMTNCYIIRQNDRKEVVVIDPGAEVDKIMNYLQENDLVCEGVLLTHGHFDHIIAATALATQTGAPVYAHEAEAELLKDPNLNCASHIRSDFGLIPDILLRDGEILELAGLEIKVIHTPGHTIGGVCYYIPKHDVVITGDTLFLEDIGRSDLPTGNGNTLISSIKDKLMPLSDQVKVYPGHGDPTTIGYERSHNIYISENENMFFG